MRKPKKTYSVVVDRMEPKGVSAIDKNAKRWSFRGAAIGDSVVIRGKGKSKAYIVSHEQKSPDAIVPKCDIFGLCGGCQFQTMSLHHQREEKEKMIRRLIGEVPGSFYPIIGDDGYYYRNKIELSFGTQCYVREDEKDKIGLTGSFLGFHPSGWFSKIIPVHHCPIATKQINQLIPIIQKQNLEPAWSTKTFAGKWRHIVFRQGEDGVLVGLLTSTDTPRKDVVPVANQLSKQECVSGVLWITTDRLSEVAIGDVEEILYGNATLTAKLNGKQLEIPHDGFFQVNNAGAQLLINAIRQAAGCGEVLVDLYCGVGAIGIALADSFTKVIGIELHALAVEQARKNAKNNNVLGQWYVGKVEEEIPKLNLPKTKTIVVDPPRVGLHPKVAAFLAKETAESLIYVACNPKSLVRDREILEQGNWRLHDIWSVDLFPQTPHVEVVGKFVRKEKAHEE